MRRNRAGVLWRLRCRGSEGKFIRRAVKGEIFRLEAERTNIRQIASEVLLGEDEGFPKACVANCDNIRVVPKLSLTKRAGELAPERWVEVKRAVGPTFGLTTRIS